MRIWTLAILALAAFAAPAFAEEESDSETTTRVRNTLMEAYGEKSRIAKEKASKEHDRVTIVIDKQTSAKLEATTDTEKKSSLSTTINSWFTLKVNEDGSLIAQPRTGTNKPEVDVSLNRKHEGDGETSREQSLTNKISGEVVQVLPNGQMLIAARTRIRVSGEDESVELTGRVDPRDLDSDSSLDADKIIDLRYKVTGKGDITDATKRGWLAKVIDKVNPF